MGWLAVSGPRFQVDGKRRQRYRCPTQRLVERCPDNREEESDVVSGVQHIRFSIPHQRTRKSTAPVFRVGQHAADTAGANHSPANANCPVPYPQMRHDSPVFQENPRLIQPIARIVPHVRPVPLERPRAFVRTEYQPLEFQRLLDFVLTDGSDLHRFPEKKSRGDAMRRPGGLRP